MRYFFAIDAAAFRDVITPAMTLARRHLSFGPACDLCRQLAPAAREFVQQGNSGTIEPFVLQIAAGDVPYRTDVWRLLVGEVLLFSAADVPELETPVASFAALLHQQIADDPPRFSPIQKAIEGRRDLAFGNWRYRPFKAGWNDLGDIRLLLQWLKSVDPSAWRADDLTEIDPLDRNDELEFAREWFPALTAMYRRAHEEGRIIVCEEN